MRLFNKKGLSEWYVDFSFGRVHFKQLTNKIVNKAFNESMYGTKAFNINNFYMIFEYELLNLSSKRIDNLFIEDSRLLRNKVKELLLYYNILSEQKVVNKKVEDDVNIFKREDIEWFENTKNKAFNKLGGLNGR